jgi:translocation and assembly module TamB
MTTRRRTFGRAVRKILVLLLLAALLLAFLAGTPYGRARMANGLSAALSRTPSRVVVVRGLSGSWASHLRVDEVTVGDAAGPWLSIEGLSIRWKATELWRNRLRLDEVDVERATLFRRPEPDAGPAPARSGWPPPVSILLETATVHRLDVRPEVFGHALQMSVGGRGSASSDRARIDAGAAYTYDDQPGRHASARIDWRKDEIRFAFQGEFPAPAGRPLPITPESFQAAGTFNLPDRSGSLQVELRHDGETAEAATRFQWTTDQLRFTDITARALNTTLAGGLTLQFAGALVSGTVTGAAENVGSIANRWGVEAAGRAAWSLAFSAPSNRQDLLAQLELRNLATAPATGRILRARAEIQDVRDQPVFHVRAVGHALQAGSVALRRAELNVDGRREDALFSFQAQGHPAGAGDLSLTGSWKRETPDTLAVTVTAAAGQWAGVPFRLLEPATLEQSAGRWHVDVFQASAAGGQIAASAAIDPDGSVRARAELTGLTPASLPVARNLEIEGRGAAHLELAGTLAEPTVNARMEWTGVRSRSRLYQTLAPLDLALDLGAKGGRLRGALRAEGAGAGRLELAAEMTIDFALQPWLLDFDLRRLDRIRLESDLNLGVLNHLPFATDQQVGGRLLAHLDYRHDEERVRLTGPCRIEGGRYEHLYWGTLLRNLNAQLVVDGNRLILQQAGADDGGRGKFRAEGQFAFQPEAHFPFAFQLHLDHAQLVRLDALSAAGSGRLELSGDRHRVQLGGRIGIVSALLRPDFLPPRPPPELPVEEIGTRLAPSNGESEEFSPAAPSRAPRLEGGLRIDLDGPAVVKGLGLDSTWAGGLSLNSQPEGWALNGSLETRRGSFLVFSRPFKITEGRILFDGSAPPAPQVDIAAEFQRADITAYVSVRGPYDAPELILRSIPDLPQDEILARILFGKSLATITPLQAVQLAGAVRSMGGGRSAWNLTERTQLLLRVDQLELRETGGENGQTEVVAGKDLTSSLHVEVKQSLGAEASGIRLEYELTPHLSVETEAGGQLRPGAGLNWKFSY